MKAREQRKYRALFLPGYTLSIEKQFLRQCVTIGRAGGFCLCASFAFKQLLGLLLNFLLPLPVRHGMGTALFS